MEKCVLCKEPITDKEPVVYYRKGCSSGQTMPIHEKCDEKRINENKT